MRQPESWPDAETLVFLLRNSTEMIARQDAQGRFLYVSPACREIFGCTPAEIVGLGLYQLVHADHLSAVRASLETLGEASNEASTCTYRICRPDGSVRWVETTFTALFDEAGQLCEIHSSTRDINRFKKLGLAIEKVAAEWRTAVDSARDVIMMINRDFRIVRVNLPATRFFARSFGDLVGQDVEAVVGGMIKGSDPLHLRKAREPGRHDEQEIYIEEAGVWVLLTVDAIVDDGGSWCGAVCQMRDITERKRGEEKLRSSLTQVRDLAAHLQSVREDERSKISREIHDELGHALTALKLDLVWLGAGLDVEQRPLSERAASMIELVDRTIASVRRISTDLRPAVLDGFGLVAAIEWQAEEFSRHTGIATKVEIETEDLSLDDESRTAVFRIFQEALTNVARHADADRARVILRRSNDNLVLCIEDNGRGLDPDRSDTARSFGIMSMKERALVLGGEFRIEGEPGKGTSVSVRIPLSREEPGR